MLFRIIYYATGSRLLIAKKDLKPIMSHPFFSRTYSSSQPVDCLGDTMMSSSCA